MASVEDYIEAHILWRAHLLNAIRTGEDIPDRVAAADDRECALGHWIFGENGQRNAGNSNYETLKDFHQQFHAYVGEVIDLIQAGKKEDAMEHMEDVKYYQILNKVTSSLKALSGAIP